MSNLLLNASEKIPPKCGLHIAFTTTRSGHGDSTAKILAFQSSRVTGVPPKHQAHSRDTHETGDASEREGESRVPTVPSGAMLFPWLTC